MVKRRSAGFYVFLVGGVTLGITILVVTPMSLLGYEEAAGSLFIGSVAVFMLLLPVALLMELRPDPRRRGPKQIVRTDAAAMNPTGPGMKNGKHVN